jgi:hypothetical protein
MPLGNALGLRWKLNFCLNRPPDTLSQADRRMVNAAEYIAYHLGQMDKKLDRLIVLLEASAQTKS